MVSLFLKGLWLPKNINFFDGVDVGKDENAEREMQLGFGVLGAKGSGFDKRWTTLGTVDCQKDCHLPFGRHRATTDQMAREANGSTTYGLTFFAAKSAKKFTLWSFQYLTFSSYNELSAGIFSIPGLPAIDSNYVCSVLSGSAALRIQPRSPPEISAPDRHRKRI